MKNPFFSTLTAKLLTDHNWSWSTLELLLMGCVCTLLACLGQFYYNRYNLYHMSRKVAGPFAWPLIGNGAEFMGSPTRIFNNVMGIFDKYPDLCRVWLGMRLFYGVSKPEYLEIVMNSPHALAKEDLYKYAQPLVGQGLFTATVPTWKRHRKLIMPAFNQRILDQFVDVFAEQSSILCHQLALHTDDVIDIFHLLTRCTLDIVCETSMGIKLNIQTGDDKIHFGNCIDRCLEVMFVRMFDIWYHFDWIFKWTRLAQDERRCIRTVHEFTENVVRERRTAFESRRQSSVSVDGKQRKAFLDLLLELSSAEKEQKAKLTDEELRDEVTTFLIAGSDTTASTLSFLFIMLGMHPVIQDRVYNEILDVVGVDRPVEAHDLPLLKYTECVVKETLRLFPVGAFIVRAVHDDIKLDDRFTLPRGSSTVLGILSVQRSATYWPQPLQFVPDRFLPHHDTNRHPYTYMPFSAGPRNCMGPRYATMVLKSITATVLRQYRIRTPYRSVDDIKLKTNLVLRPQDGFQVSFEKRSSL